MTSMTKHELQHKVLQLSKLSQSEASTVWGKRRQALRTHFEKDDIEDFLRWSTINATMFVRECDMTHAQLIQLRSVPKWEFYAETALMENSLGNPPRLGAMAYTSGNLVNQTYHLHQWERMTRRDVKDLTTIVEFGGGYGAMSAICRRMGFEGDYYIYDFPEFCLLQEYYLTNLGYEVETIDVDRNTDYRRITQFTPDIDLLIACHSLSEVPFHVREDFIANLAPLSCLFVYQKKFDGIDNIGWFQMLTEKWKGYNHASFVGEADEKERVNYLISDIEGVGVAQS
jgi:hypothetical protein